MKKDMTTGNPLKIILLFSIPVLLGNLFQQLYNMVDAIIVGRYLGEEALAAVGSTGAISFLVVGFAIGMAQGFGVKISQAFGAKDYRRMQHYIAVSLILGVLISVILTVPTVSASTQILRAMKTPEDIIAMANDYVSIIYMGIICTMAYNIAACILRGIGDSRTPLLFLILSSFLNIGLDLLFIVVFKTGTAGAAYATIIAQGISAVFCFLYIFGKVEILRVKREEVYLDFMTIKQLLEIGIPMAINYSMISVGMMIQQSAVNTFGSTAVAAYTAAAKVENLSTQACPTLGAAMSTYCGQNLGAGKLDRIYEGMKKAGWIAVAVALGISAVCTLGGNWIVSWFIEQPTAEIYAYSRQYLLTISTLTLPLVHIFLYRSALQGLNEGFIPMVSGFVELFCRVFAIAVWLKPLGYTCVCITSPFTWVITDALLITAYFLWEHKMKKKYPAGCLR